MVSARTVCGPSLASRIVTPACYGPRRIPNVRSLRRLKRLPPDRAGTYPARAGGPWLWSTLVLFLFHALVVPSGLTTRVQPHR